GQRWNMLAPRLILTTRAELEGTGQQPGLASPIWRAGQAYDAASGIRLLQALNEAPVAQYRFQIPTPPLKPPTRELQERDFRPVHVVGAPVSARLQDRQRLNDLYRTINDTKTKPAPGVAVWEEYVALLNAALTPATQAVLDLVSRFGYLSAAHIALVQGSSESWVRRYLLALKRQQIIVAWQPYHYPPLYCPTRPALYRLYRQRGWTARRALNRSQLYVGPGKDIPGQHLTHTLGVRDFFAQCYESARGAGDRLLDWRSEEECERRFVYHGETRSLRPDGYGRLYRHGKVWPFYLEWEHGSRHWQAGYREKLGSYHAYRFTQAPYAIEGHFPTILVVALTSEQSDWVCQAARQAAYEYEQPCLPVRVATKDDLHHQGLWGPIWRGPLTDDSRDKGLPFG
ncbi:MAG: replication-relaxation family protein, partial [Chloroflexi bacterium]|nr:replication-relaxation family protein [Chloroflexota bacterium]